MLKMQVSSAPSSVNWCQLLEEVYQDRPTHKFKAGSTIPLHPRDIWIVYRGLVQLSTLHCDGEEAILGLVYPEMPFGAPLTQLEPYEAVGLTEVVLMRLSQTEIEQSSELAQGILLQLNRRLQQTEALLALISQRLVSDRLQQLLLLLQKELGQVTPDGVRIGVRLTHQQLANLLGTTRVSVTRLLAILRKKGWLSIDLTNHIVIHNSTVLSIAIKCRKTVPNYDDVRC